MKPVNGRGRLKFIIVIFLKTWGKKSFVRNCSALNAGSRQNILSQSVNEILANKDIAMIPSTFLIQSYNIFFKILKHVSKIVQKKRKEILSSLEIFTREINEAIYRPSHFFFPSIYIISIGCWDIKRLIRAPRKNHEWI